MFQASIPNSVILNERKAATISYTRCHRYYGSDLNLVGHTCTSGATPCVSRLY